MSTNDYLKNWKIESDNSIDFKGYRGRVFVSTCTVAGYKSKTKVILIQQENKTINLNTTSSLSDYEKNKKITDLIFESVIFEN